MATSITSAPEKVVLAYPSELGSKSKTDQGFDTQYIVISIYTDEKASKLKGDKKYADSFAVASTSRTTGFTSLEKNTDPDVALLDGQAAADQTAFVKQKGVIKLNRAIVLPMPNDLVVPTSVSYSEVPATLLSKGAEFFDGPNKTETLKDFGRVAAATGQVGGVSLPVISSVVNSLKNSGITDARAIFAASREAINPRKEILFDDFGFRRYSFRFTFAPRNQKESDDVNEIIRTLRFYSLPELSATKVFYLFPAEFEVSFMNGAQRNKNIPKMARSALERVTVNLSPNGTWATLPNASPVQIDMTLDFLELELIDRNRVFNPDSEAASGF